MKIRAGYWNLIGQKQKLLILQAASRQNKRPLIAVNNQTAVNHATQIVAI